MKEIWKDVVGYEGLYQISNIGRIKSLNYNKTKKENIMKQRCVKGKEYFSIGIMKDGVSKEYKIHRLVAIAFIPNPDNKPQINHKDSDPKNNNVENLEWCTSAENIQHAFKYGRKTQKGEKNNMCSHPDSIIKQMLRYKNLPMFTQQDISDIFGIDRRYISAIFRGKVRGYLQEV